MLNWPAKKCEKVESFLRKKNLTSICFLLLCCLWGSYEKKSFRKGKREKRGRQIFDIKEWKEEIMQAAFVWHGELGKYC